MDSLKSGWTFEIVETEDEFDYQQSFNQNPYVTESLSYVPKQVAEIRSESAINLEKKANELFYRMKYDEAELVYKHAIEAYGENNDDALECSYNLAKIYQEQSRNQEAEQLFEQIYIRVRNLSNRQSLCQLVVNKLATIYDESGRQADAEYMLMRAVFISESSVNQDIQYVENCMNHLLKIYSTTSDSGKAFELRKKLSNLKRQHFGYAI